MKHEEIKKIYTYLVRQKVIYTINLSLKKDIRVPKPQ